MSILIIDDSEVDIPVDNSDYELTENDKESLRRMDQELGLSGDEDDDNNDDDDEDERQ